MRKRSSLLLGLIVFSAALLACEDSTPLPDDLAAIERVEVAWDDSGLPSAGDCLEGVEVERYASKPEYVSACDGPAPGAGGRAAAEMSAGCLTHAARGLFDRVPVIHVAPGFERDIGLIQHEALHALVGCRLDRPITDPLDGRHSDPRVWAASGGVSSVQAIAFAATTASGGRFTGAGPTARG